MARYLCALLLMLLLWSGGSSLAQVSTNEFSISFLTTRDGLSQASNRYMLQDKKGYMWISSQDGINRYNGLTFSHFDDLRYYHHCRPFKQVFGLIEDNRGDIWIGSPQGLYRYSQTAEQFTQVDFSKQAGNGTFLKPFAVVNGNVWVSDASSSFYAVDPVTENIHTLFRAPDTLSLQQGYVINPQVDKNGNIWTFSGNKIIFIDVHRAFSQQYPLLTRSMAVNGAEIKSIALEAASGVLGISTIHGLKLFDITSRKFIAVHDPGNWITNNETHYLKAEQGVFLLSAKGHPLLQLQAKGMSLVSLLDTQTAGGYLPLSYEPVCLYRDRWNRIWYNMDGEFIAIIDFAKPFFKKLTKDMHNGLPHGTVVSITAIGDSILICDGKLTVLNKKNGAVEKKGWPSTFTSDDTTFHTIWYDSAGRRVWLASEETVFYYDLAVKKLAKTTFTFTDNVDYKNPIRAFAKCNNGPLIIGAITGVYLWDEKSNSSRQLQLAGNSGVVQLDQLSGDRLAISTYNKQLHLFKTSENGLQALTSLRFDYIVSGVAEDSQRGVLWAATEYGVYKIDNRSYRILRHYTKSNGMAKDLVYSIRCDRSGWVWCSTNHGIVAIDPLKEHIMNFDVNYNLQDLEFNRGAVASDADGYIYFGGVRGINYFKPPFQAADAVSPKLVIEDANINNQPYGKGNPDALTEIRYAYGAALLSLKAVALHLKSAPTFKVMYRLNSDPNNWVELENGTAIQFFDLAPGRYKLEIGCKNALAGAPEIRRTLAIIVLPPWYQTLWFYGLCAIVLAALIYGYFQLRLRQRLEVLQVRNRLHRDLHDDVGATLSSVKAYSEILGKNGNQEIIASLIKENAAEMIDRLEVISWATNPQHDNAKSLVDAMLRFAWPVTHANGIELTYHQKGVDDNLLIPGDVRQHLLLIAKETINNIVKYAGATQCSVTMAIRSQAFVLTVADNGKGADGVQRGGGFGLKNMQQRAEEMNGQLFVKSGPGKGTSVIVSIPYPFRTKKINDVQKTNGL